MSPTSQCDSEYPRSHSNHLAWWHLVPIPEYTIYLYITIVYQSIIKVYIHPNTGLAPPGPNVPPCHILGHTVTSTQIGQDLDQDRHQSSCSMQSSSFSGIPPKSYGEKKTCINTQKPIKIDICDSGYLSLLVEVIIICI